MKERECFVANVC